MYHYDYKHFISMFYRHMERIKKFNIPARYPNVNNFLLLLLIYKKLTLMVKEIPQDLI